MHKCPPDQNDRSRTWRRRIRGGHQQRQASTPRHRVRTPSQLPQRASCSVALKLARMCEVLSFYLSGFEGHLIATEEGSLSYGDLGILPFYRNGDGIGTADVTGLVTPPSRLRILAATAAE